MGLQRPAEEGATSGKKEIRAQSKGGQNRQNLDSPEKLEKRIVMHNRCQSEKKKNSFKQPGEF